MLGSCEVVRWTLLWLLFWVFDSVAMQFWVSGNVVDRVFCLPGKKTPNLDSLEKGVDDILVDMINQ